MMSQTTSATSAFYILRLPDKHQTDFRPKGFQPGRVLDVETCPTVTQIAGSTRAAFERVQHASVRAGIGLPGTELWLRVTTSKTVFSEAHQMRI